MSIDEFLALLASTFLALFIWGRWLVLKLHLKQFAPAASFENTALVFSLVFSALLLFALLANYASSDVRDSGIYLTFYLVMGAAVVGLATAALGGLGLGLRDDVIERRNPASALALGGAIPGLTLAYAGSNIGDGPGWWVVVFCSALSVGGLLLGWLVLDRITNLGETITVERNRAAGLRIGAWFIATGAILGRAAAGNWIDVENTLNDFGRIGLGALGLLGLTLGLEIWARPTSDHPKTSLIAHGFVPGIILLCLSALYLNYYGRW
ncbi:MAG: hypothetical protein WC205_12455 [Opitutaceae bacterium]|jgi:uncharacterized membrane protein YjfL (UPF0719 family)